MPKKPKKKVTLRDLFPHHNEEQLMQAEETMDRYLEVVWRIYKSAKERGLKIELPKKNLLH